MRTLVLLLGLVALSTQVVHHPVAQFDHYHRQGQAILNPCEPSPCGYNTICRVRDDRSAECRCKEGYFPDPDTIRGCKPQCTLDSDCHHGFRCTGNRCTPVCSPNPCGINAVCEARGNRALCQCLPGYVGQAAHRCHPEEPKRLPKTLVITHHDPCHPSPCGANAECRVRGERPVCYCQTNHHGDPYRGCIRGECSSNEQCPSGRACNNFHCINPCSTACGVNAECEVRNHVAICRCPHHYKGDPFNHCRRFDPEELCHPSPCGPNTNCRVEGERPICSCLPGYEGSPITGCRHECEHDSECPGQNACVDFKCRNPCSNACGQYANCEVRNHRAVCTCPTDYLGDPLTRCYPECTHHSDCPSHKACHGVKCTDPCVGACGLHAQCEVTNHKAICSCPKGYTGHPFDRCRPFEPADLCIPNPCGANAKCTPGHDVTGKERPVCTCPPGYFGDALHSCRPGECQSDADCPNHKACVANHCKNPCDGTCGINAICEPHNHAAVCSCTRGYTGDPFVKCHVDPEYHHTG